MRPITMRDDTGTPKPRDADIVVSRRDIDRLVRYDVGVQGGPPQYTEDTYERALNRADSFARDANVDVWYTEDGKRFRLMTSRRNA